MSKSKQAGATLIESLVSLVILAIAIIGMLGVQVRTLMETNVAANRTQAMLLAEDLSERIKGNPGGYAALSLFADKEVTALPTSSLDCASTACNSNQLAAYDIQEWSRSVIRHLPGGRAQTFLSPADNRQLGVLIGWQSKEKSDATAYTDPVISSDLKDSVTCWSKYICHLIYIQP